MDREQQSNGERGRAITIHIRITPLSILLVGLLGVAALIGLAALAAATGVTVAAGAGSALPATPAQASPYPAPLSARALAPAPYPAPTSAAPQAASPVPPTASSAALSPPVGLGLPPPVFNLTRVAEPPALEAPPVTAAPIPPAPTQPDLVLDLDTPIAGLTALPPPTAAVAPSAIAVAAVAAAPAASGDPPATPPPSAAPPPAASLSGTVRWTVAQSPLLITINQQVAPGATLIIEPGVEVRLSAGVSIIVNGALITLGTPQQPVRIVGAAGQRWGELVGTPGSTIALSATQLRDGGAGGTLISSESGRLVLRDTQLRGNFGQVRATDSAVEISGLELAGNSMPYGAALQLGYRADNTLAISNSRISDNRLSPGAAALQIAAQGAVEGIRLVVRGNLLTGDVGPSLEILANAIMSGEIVCNALLNGSTGLSLFSDAPLNFDPGLTIAANVIAGQTPPIIPFYIEHGIGRGATSALPVSMANNWWDSPLGPYAPDQNADGRGEAVGPNITFAPWLRERPACAPLP